MPEQDDEGFLMRWSRRKRAVTRGEEASAERTTEAAAGPVGKVDEKDANGSEAEYDVKGGASQKVPDDLAAVDIDSMTYESDYTRFLEKDVPEALRRRALRQLWRSDPVLANVDGLCDYDDDFTDAALAVSVLQTIHKVGRGYLDDEDEDAEAAAGMAEKGGAEAEPGIPLTASSAEASDGPAETEVAENDAVESVRT